MLPTSALRRHYIGEGYEEDTGIETAHGSTLPHTPQAAHVGEGHFNLALASQANDHAVLKPGSTVFLP
jgi:hypothetical protein